MQTAVLEFLKKTLEEIKMELKTLNFGVAELMVSMLDIFGRLGVWLLENVTVCSKNRT